MKIYVIICIMRKISAVVLIFLVVILVSCGGYASVEENTSSLTADILPTGFTYTDSDDAPYDENAIIIGRPEVVGDYLYWGGGTTLMRYNVRTGNVTTVCADPLCDHKTKSCPMDRMESDVFHVLKDYVVFVKCFPTDEGFITQLCRYDIALKKLSVIEKMGNNGFDLMELYIGSMRYYKDAVYNDTTDKWESRLCRMDVSAATPADTVLMADSNLIPAMARFAFTLDDRIYLSDGAILYSVSKDLTDAREVYSKAGSCTDGEYIYYSSPLDKAAYDTPLALCSIHRMKIDGTGDTDFGTVATPDWVLTEKYIYYLEYDSVVVGKNRISYYPGSEVTLECSKLYRMNHDGSGKELVYTFSGEETGTRFHEWTVAGNYVYGTYASFNDRNGDGTITDDEVYGSSYSMYDPVNLIRIDLTTGEVWHIYDIGKE